jgi:hypothetical protein
MFRKVDLFVSSGEGRETPALFGPIERANLSQKTFCQASQSVLKVVCDIKHFLQSVLQLPSQTFLEGNFEMIYM